MSAMTALLALCVLLALALPLAARAAEDEAAWTIYVANDNCPDYTWGYTEEQTRRAFADVVRGHLDEMNRTDGEQPANRDRYNMAVTHEAICFVEHYPERKDELIRRIREGRAYVSPFLCNSLWAFQGVEGAIRTLYPARRLAEEWGFEIDVAEHIEEPSLPWGVASILAGCGVRWLSVAYLGYDSTFGGLTNPPAFILEGQDGAQLRVVMDPWASGKFSYTQGARILRNPEVLTEEWLPHYAGLGDAYPVRHVLASGTHGDISPESGSQARGFADAIIAHNGRPDAAARLVNAVLPQYCRAIDEAQEAAPFLHVLRGSFGHSWDLWPVCLAKYAADMREGERAFLAAEALLSAAIREQPALHEATRADRERAEWCLAMLSDHAWNGTHEENKRHNADLRRDWARELNRLAGDLTGQGWAGLGLEADPNAVAVFNALSVPRADLVRVEDAADRRPVTDGGERLPCQAVEEDGERVLYFLSPEVPGFGLVQLGLEPAQEPAAGDALRATADELEGPYYLLRVDPATGGLAGLLHRPTGTELVAPGGRGLCQTVYFDGAEHTLEDVRCEVAAEGPVLARLSISGTAAGVGVTNFVTLYAGLDRVDFDLRVTRPAGTQEERLCQVFPVMGDGAVLRIETTGAVIRPLPQPEGDLLPGADARRFAVQGFVDASRPGGRGVTVAPLDAFTLRLDLDPLTFEALGNDQNYREVVQDQDGVTEFRFRYALWAHPAGYSRAEAVAWSRCAAASLLAARGRLSTPPTAPPVELDPARAVATCLKPADGPASRGAVLRVWETAGASGPLRIGVAGCEKAVATDLLERDRERVEIVDGAATVDLPAYGFAALRLSE